MFGLATRSSFGDNITDRANCLAVSLPPAYAVAQEHALANFFVVLPVIYFLHRHRQMERIQPQIDEIEQ